MSQDKHEPGMLQTLINGIKHICWYGLDFWKIENAAGYRMLQHALNGEYEQLAELKRRGEFSDEAFLDRVPRIKGYRIMKYLGEGADGLVYLAIDKNDKEVKIKVFKSTPESKIARAMRQEDVTLEERIARRFELQQCITDKSAIAQAYAVGTCRDPRTWKKTCYIVSDYVDGGPCEVKDVHGRYVIRDDITYTPHDIFPIYKIAHTDIPYRVEICTIFDGLLRGLGAIHDAGLVLKDIKLRNLLLSKDKKRVLLDDLETISSAQDVREGLRLTEGSDRYAAPEVLHNPRRYSVQSDLYAATVCLLHLLSGDSYLLKGINSFEEKRYTWELHQLFRRRSNIHDRLLLFYDFCNHESCFEPDSLFPIQETKRVSTKDFFLTALHYDPAQRYQSADELRDAFFAARPDGTWLNWWVEKRHDLCADEIIDRLLDKREHIR